MSNGYVGGLNFYGVHRLVFSSNKASSGQLTLSVYSDRDCFNRLFTLEFHPEWGTGSGIKLDLPSMAEVQS